MLFDCVDMMEAPFWGVLIANDGVKASLNFQPNLPQLQCHNSLWNRPFVRFRVAGIMPPLLFNGK